MSHTVSVYGKNRDIPWTHNGQASHVRLVAGSPKEIDDEELIEHLRKFNRPEEGRGIEIVEIPENRKNPSRMTLQELRDLAGAAGVAYDEADSRSDIMKKIRGEDNE